MGKITNKQIQNLEEYLSSVRKLDIQVEKQLIEIVKANGNLILCRGIL
jgi:hypothetical protein